MQEGKEKLETEKVQREFKDSLNKIFSCVKVFFIINASNSVL